MTQGKLRLGLDTDRYSFDELSPKAQQHAIESHRYINTEHGDWWQPCYEDFYQIGSIMGIEIDNIFFSGFSSQGDGACFEGRYSFAPGAAKKLRAHAPKDEKLAVIMRGINEAQRPFGYTASARVKHMGHYCHSGCTEIEVTTEKDSWAHNKDEKPLRDALRAFMDWMYQQLEVQHDYLVSDEVVKETMESNDYEFDIEGNAD